MNLNFKYLDQIQGPENLKFLSKKELFFLADEIRQFLIENVQKTGGHLGVNLGVVELTISLHYFFDFPLNDNLIFDVGHQSYVHKILTSRKNQFHSLKKIDGLSGYTNPQESLYDLFMFGHAGTGLSVASGIARIKKNEEPFSKHKVVLVVGDASIASGISFEALNHIDASLNNLIIILNDNGMSISKTVGALADNLFSYKNRGKKSWISSWIDIFFRKRKLRSFFRIFNLDYYGPVDGHDIKKLLLMFNAVKHKNKPIIIHVLTEKGKGFSKANNDNEKCHAIKAIENKEGSVLNPVYRQTYTDVFADYIVRLAREDKKIITLTAAMTSGTGLEKFQKEFPDRFFDCGIAEQHTVAMAAGMSFLGWKPVCSIYSTFLQRAYDQIFQEVALNKRKIVFIIDRAGIVGEDGASHAGIYDIAYLRVFPNFILMSPKDAIELRCMVFFALNVNHQGPIAIRWPKDYVEENLLSSSSQNFQKIELGSFELLEIGKDIIIIAYGSMVEKAYKTAQILKKRNISSYVINLRFAKPINHKPLLDILALKLPVFILEEHSILGGIYTSILEIYHQYLRQSKLAVFPIYSVSIPDLWVKHGKREALLSYYNCNIEELVEFIVDKL